MFQGIEVTIILFCGLIRLWSGVGFAGCLRGWSFRAAPQATRKTSAEPRSIKGSSLNPKP